MNREKVGWTVPIARPGNRGGFTLIETLLGLVLLGLVSAAFLGGVAISDKATFISRQRTTAESLARSQLENVKNSSYINYAVPGHPLYSTVATPASYTLAVTVEPIDPNTQQPLPSGQDQGLQKVTVTIHRNGVPVIAIADFKVNR